MSRRGCSYDGCLRPHKGRGYCCGHLQQIRAGRALRPLKRKTRELCDFIGCGKVRVSRNWCQGHWKQHKAARQLTSIEPRVVDRRCSYAGCENRHSRKGFCEGHHRQVEEGRELRPLYIRNRGNRCGHPGCLSEAKSLNHCRLHYVHLLVHGETRDRVRRPRGSFDVKLDRASRAAIRRAAVALPGVTDRDWGRLVARYGGFCAYCQEVPWQHIEHVVPLSRGGLHSIGNVLPACARCNCSKGNKLIVEWKRKQIIKDLPPMPLVADLDEAGRFLAEHLAVAGA